MEKERDLFKGGMNPHYEARTSEDAALTEMALNAAGIRFTPVSYNIRYKAVRFYVDHIVDLDPVKQQIKAKLQGAAYAAQNREEVDKFKKQFE